ncbi:MAG TPA: TonB-dependent receptor [Terriglobia bacterium]|nr:TonB-dependent receptor [Terriglobia bacterium]
MRSLVKKIWTRQRAWKQFRVLFLLLAMVVAASFAVAQLPTGTILGVVRDASGAILPGAGLTVTNTETALSRTAISSEDGSYRFPALPAGRYEVRAEVPGFQTAVRSGLTLAVGQEAVINFTLVVGAVSQTVEVTGEAPLVNITSSSLGGLVSEDSVADLPLNGRNYVDLTFLQPGISENKNMTHGGTFTGSWFSSNGSPLRSNTYMLDGAVMGNFLGGAASSIANTTLGIEGIREWRVVTNTFSAEYGLTMGSQMAIVTKSGTNSFHGSLFEYLRNSALDARNFFDYKTELTPGRLPPFKRNNFGGSIGGPLKKDKLFFFGTYEALRERLGITSIANTIPAECRQEPLPADGSCRFDGDRSISPLIKPVLALFPMPNLPGNRATFPFSQPTNENYGQVRLDSTISNADTVFGRFTHDETRQNTTLAFPGFITDRYSKNQYVTLSESHVFSPALLNTFRFSSSKTRNFLTSPTNSSGPQYELVTGKGLGVFNISGLGEFGPRPSAPLVQNQDVYSWSDDLFYTRGTHSLKFGSLINRYQQYNVSGASSTGQAVFPSITHFLRATPSSYTARAVGSFLDAKWRFATLGFYLQDDWRVRSNFTVNAGLRYEFRTTPVEAFGHGGAIRNILVDAQPTCADKVFCLQAHDPGKPFDNGSLRNFSPRVGFAWDVRGDGKTAVRAGAAILYDVPLWGVLSVGYPYSSTVRGTTNFTLPLVFPAGPGARSAGGPNFDLGQPYSVQSNFTIERELPWDMAATVSYVGNRGTHLYRRTEGNPLIPAGTPGVDANGNRVCRNAGPVAFDPTGPKCWLGTETRVNRNWDAASRIQSDSNSFYNALQVQLRKRLGRGLQFQGSYTYSKAIDETQGLVDAENLTSHYAASDPFNRLLDRGVSSFDITHNWSFNTIYRLPQLISSGGPVGGLLNGWWVSGIFRVNNGLPFTPTLGANRSRSGVLGNARGLDRPDLVAGIKAADINKGTSRGCDFIAPGTPVGTPNLWFDPCAFTIPPDGFLGTAGRNIVRGPGLTNLDFSMAKDTPLRMFGENGKLEFRAEVFNILNHANFATPEIGLGDTLSAALVFPGSPSEFGSGGNLIPQQRLPSVGKILRTITPSRQIQFSLKLMF